VTDIDVRGRSPAGRRLSGLLRVSAALLGIPLCLTLSACAGGTMDDLVDYVAKIKARKSRQIAPLPEIKVPEFYVYRSSKERDPFAPFVEEEPEPVAIASNSGITPPENHIREELEYFPLDSLRMVGTLEMRDDVWALITAPDGAVHRIRTGNYVGKNYGKVTLVADDRLELLEIVPDGMGGWQERSAKMDLVE
jgi:type IV pilus assembly protein PilP